MTTTIVHLVRHGEVHNPRRILYGRLPGYHLSERGQAQARRTASVLADHDIAAIYCSPLERAQETAQPLAELTGLSPQVEEGLIEEGNQLEGLLLRSWRSDLWKPKYWPLLVRPNVPSWGEPYDVMVARMMRTVEMIRQEVEGREGVAVSHQLPIVLVQRLIRGQNLALNLGNRECALASVTSLVFDGEEIVDLVYSDVASDVVV